LSWLLRIPGEVRRPHVGTHPYGAVAPSLNARSDTSMQKFRRPTCSGRMLGSSGQPVGWASTSDLGFGSRPKLHGMQVLMSDRIGYVAGPRVS
jgi:hypothetical protein